MNNYDYIGYTGTFFISINLLPQIYHVYKIKDVKSISVMSYVLNIISSVVMIIYALFIDKIPILISNSMIMLFSCIMLLFKYYYSV